MLCGEAFQLPVSQTPQRGIFTNISQLKISHSRGNTLSTLSRVPADSRFPSFLLFPRYIRRRDASRFSHRRERIIPEIRQKTIFACQSRSDFLFAPCNVYHYLFHTLARECYLSRELRKISLCTPITIIYYVELFCTLYVVGFLDLTEYIL